MLSFREHLVVWGVVVAMFVAGGVAIVYESRAHDRWVAWCTQQGGHVTDHTSTTTGVGLSGSGNPVVTTGTDTTYYCLSPDGRILAIES